MTDTNPVARCKDHKGESFWISFVDLCICDLAVSSMTHVQCRNRRSFKYFVLVGPFYVDGQAEGITTQELMDKLHDWMWTDADTLVLGHLK